MSTTARAAARSLYIPGFNAYCLAPGKLEPVRDCIIANGV
jgi:hypothetical protein